MKNFYLLEILIYSAKEKKARRVLFHQRQTIILGKNDTGKSVLIKSIYHAFGADVKFDSKWDNAAACSLVHFTLNSKKYSILRWGRSFGLFDEKQLLIGMYESVSKELAPALAQLFDFGMVWNNRQNETITLPPAYFFLPFYIDQDKSWNANWNSFEYLNNYENWRSAVVEYHTGLKPNEYYKAKTSFDKLKDTSNEKLKEVKMIRGLLENVNKTLSIVDFTIDIGVFKKEVDELLNVSATLYKNQLQHKSNLTQLYSLRINLENQEKVVKSVLNEMQKDLRYVTDYLDETVECPTCGAHYTNSFKERFAIAEDEHKCAEVYDTIYQELKNSATKIRKEQAKLYEIEQDIDKIQKILATQQEQILLRDIIENEGKKMMKTVFELKIEEMNKELGQLMIQLKELENTIKSFMDKDRRERIIGTYKRLMKEFLAYLNVVNLSTKDYEKIDCRINGLGSTKPRALLAYYYAILHIIKKYGSSTFCPIIIDEPDQQGQDDTNMPNVLNFITNHIPKNAQLILGLQSTENIDFDGSIIEIKDGSSMLKEADYKSVQLEITPFINNILKNRNELFESF